MTLSLGSVCSVHTEGLGHDGNCFMLGGQEECMAQRGHVKGTRCKDVHLSRVAIP
jgi:hypothetical protein